MPKLSVKIEALTKGLSAQLQGARAKFKSFGASLKRIGAGVLGAGAAFGGVIFKLGMMGAKLEQSEIAMETFLGSAEKAKKVMADLKEFANVTPFDTNAVIEAGRVLLAAGVSTEDLTDRLRMLGDIAAGTDKPLLSMVQLFVSIKNKGRATFDELNQLANAGVISFSMLEEQFKKDKEGLRKFVEAGNVGFKELLPMMQNLTKEGGKFGGMLDKLSKSAGGRLSTLIGKLQITGAEFGKQMLPDLISITDTFIDWNDQAKNLKGPLGAVLKLVTGIANILETTRADKNFMGIETVGGGQTGFLDTAADAMAKGLAPSELGPLSTFSDAINPLTYLGKGMQMAGFGVDAKTQQFLDMEKEQLNTLKNIDQNLKGGQF